MEAFSSILNWVYLSHITLFFINWHLCGNREIQIQIRHKFSLHFLNRTPEETQFRKFMREMIKRNFFFSLKKRIMCVG